MFKLRNSFKKNPYQSLPSNKKNEDFTPEPIKKLIDLEYIINNPPIRIITKNNVSKKQNNSSNINKQIVDKILDYNIKKWKYGNTGNTNKLMKEDEYKLFLKEVENIIINQNQNKNQNQMKTEGNSEIIKEIREIRKIGLPKVNQFYSIKLDRLFPDIPGLNEEKYFVNVTLLGLAAIIGSEHLVIYFLMCGEDPSIIYQLENKDTGTLMLLYQIKLAEINAKDEYFIVLERLLYILFLLGSVGSGIDLSRIFNSNFEILIEGGGKSRLQESILHELANMPYIKNDNISHLKLNNGGSIPLLLQLLVNNNLNKPKLWTNINTQDSPLQYTVLYSILMNNTINNDQIKLSLVYYLIEKGADPLILPQFSKNTRINKKIIEKEKDSIQILFALLQQSNQNIYSNLVKLLSKNKRFKQSYNSIKISTPIKIEDNTIYIELKKNNDRLRSILQRIAELLKIQLQIGLSQQQTVGMLKRIKNN